MTAENVPAASLHDTERAETEMRRAIRHVKIHGYVTDVRGEQWTAALRVDGRDLFADMRHDRFPLPPDRRGEGYLFTLHTTKRGRTYIFWPPPRPVSNNRRKRLEREAHDLYRALCEPASPVRQTNGEEKR